MIITGDWHITEKTPANRIDDYEKTLFEKLEFIFKQANLDSTSIFQPGDFFDSPDPSYRLFSKVVELIKSYPNVSIYTIFGQHDLKYRNKMNSALLALEKACENLFIIKQHDSPCGVSFGEEIPNNTKKDLTLLIHKMIVGDSKIWEGQTEYTSAKNLLKTNDYQLIVSGDNHQSFIVEYQSKILINCGSLMRSSISQINHRPFIVSYYKGKYEKIMIPIKDSEEVFAMEKAELQKADNEKLESFIAGLNDQKEIGLDFETNLLSYVEKNNVEKSVVDIIKNCMK